MNRNKKLYTITQAAKMIGKSRQAVRYRVENKLMKSVEICGLKFVHIDTIRDYLKRLGNRKRLGK